MRRVPRSLHHPGDPGWHPERSRSHQKHAKCLKYIGHEQFKLTVLDSDILIEYLDDNIITCFDHHHSQDDDPAGGQDDDPAGAPLAFIYSGATYRAPLHHHAGHRVGVLPQNQRGELLPAGRIVSEE